MSIDSIISVPVAPIVGGLFLVGYLIYAFCIIYHLIRFGVGTNPKLLSLIFFTGACFFMLVSVSLFSQINFSDMVGSVGKIIDIHKIPKLPSIN